MERFFLNVTQENYEPKLKALSWSVKDKADLISS